MIGKFLGTVLGSLSGRAFVHWSALLIIVLHLSGCASRDAAPPPPPPPPAPVYTDPSDSYGPVEGSLQSVPWGHMEAEFRQAISSDAQAMQQWAVALERSAGYYQRVGNGNSFEFGNHRVSGIGMAQACRKLAAVARAGDPDRLWQELTRNHRLYRSIGRDGKGNVLVTGYYEPTLQGSDRPTQRFRYPVYRRPADIERRRPHYDRRAIDAGKKLANKGLEIAWVDDRIELFFLHIQGSGRIQFQDGRIMRIGYDNTNGHPYRSIGQLLIEEGHFKPNEVTLQGIQRWLKANPRHIDRVLYHNPSYIFFRQIRENGSHGNIGVLLTPWYSIATDHRLFPKGAPAILKTTRPNFASDGTTLTGWSPLTRMVVNQDTGGAIRGAGRVDWFVGGGEEARQTAGLMKQNRSELYFIAPRAGGTGSSEP
jgi:membrane-bound lytic murein transglycosylase A